MKTAKACLCSSRTSPRLTSLTQSIMLAASTSAWLLHSGLSSSRTDTNFSGTFATPMTKTSQLATPFSNGLLLNGSPIQVSPTLGTSCTITPWPTNPILGAITRLLQSSATSPTPKQKIPPLLTRNRCPSTLLSGMTTLSARRQSQLLTIGILTDNILILWFFQTTTLTLQLGQDMTSIHKTSPSDRRTTTMMVILIIIMI